MKEKDRKILQSLSSLGLVALSLLGGKLFEKNEPVVLAHYEPEEPEEWTPFPTYTPMKTFTQPAKEPTALCIKVTAERTPVRTVTPVPQVETATQIITNATKEAE